MPTSTTDLTRCVHCQQKVTYARSQATDKVVKLDESPTPPDEMTLVGDGEYEMISHGSVADVVLLDELRDTARGEVPVCLFVREGTGTHLLHECGDG